MSKQFSLNWNDIRRWGIHLLIVAVAAILSEVIKQIPGMNFGQYQPYAVPVISFVLKGALLFVQGKKSS